MIRLFILTGIIDYCLDRIDLIISDRFSIRRLRFVDMVVGGHYLVSFNRSYLRRLGGFVSSDSIFRCDRVYFIVTGSSGCHRYGYMYRYVNGIRDTSSNGIRFDCIELMLTNIELCR